MGGQSSEVTATQTITLHGAALFPYSFVLITWGLVHPENLTGLVNADAIGGGFLRQSRHANHAPG